MHAFWEEDSKQIKVSLLKSQDTLLARYTFNSVLLEGYVPYERDDGSKHTHTQRSDHHAKSTLPPPLI